MFPLTGGESDQNPKWSPTGEKILFLARRGYAEEEEGKELWIMDAEKKGEPTKILSRDTGIDQPRWSPNGEKILFLSRAGEKGEVQEIERIPIWSDGKGFTHYSPMNVFEINPFSGRVKQLTHSDTEVQSATYSNSGDKIAYVANFTEIKPHLKTVEILSTETGDTETLVEEVVTRYPLSWGTNDEKLLFTGHKFPKGLASHNDLWFVSVESGEMENLTDDLSKNICGGGAEGGSTWVDKDIYSDGGKSTLLQYNIDSEEIKPIIDGKISVGSFSVANGAIAYLMETKTKPIELYIRNKQGKVKQRDFQDLMEGVDYAIENYDWVDEDRMGVAGISYGGFMTNWIITHTSRFKAAVTEESVSNRLSSFGTADIGFYFTVFHIGGDPWTNLEEFLERSAILHVESVKTPTLIIHAQDDYRCWVDQAIQLFTALKYHGKETKFLLFPTGSHGISRTGKTKYRMQRLEEITKWWDEHLR